jgi:coenzyme F420-0:L-glutamate ligase/coenzyme F420-1:gamma-L-glutamate ligase
MKINFFEKFNKILASWENMLKKVEIIALEDFPIIDVGDDLGEIIFDVARKNGIEFKDFDIVVVAHKVVSKSEGRIIDIREVVPSEKAKRIAEITGKDPRFIEIVIRESKRIIKAVRGHFIVENNQGIFCANGGVDASNVAGNDFVVLLPEDPDLSAKRICEKLMKLTGKKLAVVISDTYGRMLREGQVDMAIGLYGIRPFKSYVGKEDMFGKKLKVKNIAIADEIASSAELLIGQAKEKTPVVIIRGLEYEVDYSSSAKLLNMPEEKWLFK